MWNSKLGSHHSTQPRCISSGWDWRKAQCWSMSRSLSHLWPGLVSSRCWHRAIHQPSCSLLFRGRCYWGWLFRFSDWPTVESSNILNSIRRERRSSVLNKWSPAERLILRRCCCRSLVRRDMYRTSSRQSGPCLNSSYDYMQTKYYLQYSNSWLIPPCYLYTHS